jgi:hypothetical protein
MEPASNQEVLKVAMWLLDWILRFFGAVAIPGGIYLNRKIGKHQKRLDALEMQIYDLPTTQKMANDLHKIDLAIAELSGRLEAANRIMERLERVVERQEDHLLNNGDK